MGAYLDSASCSSGGSARRRVPGGTERNAGTPEDRKHDLELSMVSPERVERVSPERVRTSEDRKHDLELSMVSPERPCLSLANALGGGLSMQGRHWRRTRRPALVPEGIVFNINEPGNEVGRSSSERSRGGVSN
jgi:hypothetical protein